MHKINDQILEEVARSFYMKVYKQAQRDRVKAFTWEQHLDSWKEHYKTRIFEKIKYLDFTVVNEWIERGNSPYVIAQFIVLLYDVDQYAKEQKRRIDSIYDPAMKQGVIDSLRNKYDKPF